MSVLYSEVCVHCSCLRGLSVLGSVGDMSGHGCALSGSSGDCQ